MQTTPPPQQTSESKIIAVLIWGVAGLFWAVLQFAATEVTYRIAEAGGPEALYDFSDTISWPASHFYDSASLAHYRKILREMQDDSTLAAPLQERARELLETPPEDDDAFEEAVWTLTDETDYDTTLPTLQEYIIYIGTCLAWGLAIAIVGLILTLCFWPSSKKPTPPAIPSA